MRIANKSTMIEIVRRSIKWDRYAIDPTKYYVVDKGIKILTRSNGGVGLVSNVRCKVPTSFLNMWLWETFERPCQNKFFYTKIFRVDAARAGLGMELKVPFRAQPLSRLFDRLSCINFRKFFEWLSRNWSQFLLENDFRLEKLWSTFDFHIWEVSKIPARKSSV